MKVLNLYAGIGGNRSAWPLDECVISIEIDPKIAAVYSHVYPNDTIVIGDSIVYLQDHYGEFDFIWSSPPCQSHGQYRHNVGVLGKGYRPIMPDMSLYAQIVFLQTYAKCLWVVENTTPYYTPLIAPSSSVGRHLIWSNFKVPFLKLPPSNIRTKNSIFDFDELSHFVINSNIPNKRQVMRNMVDKRASAHIWEAFIKSRKEATP